VKSYHLSVYGSPGQHKLISYAGYILRMSNKKAPVILEIVIKLGEKFFLRLSVKIDNNIPAENNIKLFLHRVFILKQIEPPEVN
jgi:hypothetical protein